MKKVIKEILRETKEFAEEDIDDSAKFVEGYVNAVMNCMYNMPGWNVLNKVYGIKEVEE